MSGHSKWSKIKRQKGAADQKKGAIFSKLAKEIFLAARQGGGDPEMNFSLRMVVDKAKAANMPKDNIERAIKKGTGEDTEGAQIEEIIYEGYGPGGVALLIETATDNRNRTGAEIKHILSKHGGNLGASGSVAWMFHRKGVIVIEGVTDADELTLTAIDAGAEDVEKEDTTITITTEPEKLIATKEALEAAGHTIASAELEKKPNNLTALEDAGDQDKLERIIEGLSDCDDVTNFYTNAG